jgi:transposase
VRRLTLTGPRLAGLSLTEVAKKHRISRATVCRLVNEFEKLKKSGVAQIGNQERVLVDGNNS